MTRHRLLAALTVAFAVTAVNPANSQAPAANAAASDTKTAGKPASVNGKAIPKSRVDYIALQRAAQGQPDNEQSRRSILDTLITQEILAQEAEKKGYGKSADVVMQVELARQSAMARAVVDAHLKTRPIKEENLRAEYERVKAQRGTQEYRARHILVEKEDEAKDIVDKLKKGEKFEDLAKVSKDPGSRERGGDLDWSAPTNYVKPFSDALVKLEKGKFTEVPVQTQFGWHVIRLDDVRSTQFPAFDQVRQQIFNMLQEQEIQTMISELRSKAKIE